MTPHVSRLCCALLLVPALVLHSPPPVAAQSNAATRPTPSLEERLDRLAAEIDRNRVDLHVPGAALAIVRGDKVIFARGFGFADVEKQTAMTPSTPLFIGSATKAFTATLIGMLVDEGRMRWDDAVETHLPEFRLAVRGTSADDRATIRDILGHRTGFARSDLLWASGALSSDEILRRASSVEAFAPFRQRFHYNNVHYLAAGRAAATAAGTSWDALVTARILSPLGMSDTRTSMREAWKDPRMARGYLWDEARNEFQLLSAETLNVEAIAPAGAISSTALDMAAWLRFLLRNGLADGRALISREALATTWTTQIPVGPNAGYGMGWFVRTWQGQRLIEHGGAIPGFSAQVGLLPDSDLGFVFLTNTLSPLPSLAMQLVPRYLLGELPPLATNTVSDLTPFIGRYIANFATFSNEVFTIVERNGRLVLDMPSQTESALNPPGDDGRWSFVGADQVAVSFDRSGTGAVMGLRMHTAGREFEVPREGAQVEPEIALDQLQKYLGGYRDAGGSLVFDILLQNQRLAVRLPNGTSLDLLPPDADGRRASRANIGLAIAFEESASGTVTAMHVYPPGAPAIRLTPAPNGPPLPTVAEIMKLRGIAGASALRTMRTTGRVQFPQSGVDGRFELSTAGDDRLRVDIDLDRLGQSRVALNGGRAWRVASGDPFRELAGKELRQMRLAHPSVLFGDWRTYYDAVRVVRAGEFEGRRIYVIRLESAGLPPVIVSVDAQTGDVLHEQRTVAMPGGGGLPMTTTYSDYRDVRGTRVPYRYVESNEQTGRTIYLVESVDVGVTLDPDIFTLERPPMPSGR